MLRHQGKRKPGCCTDSVCLLSDCPRLTWRGIVLEELVESLLGHLEPENDGTLAIDGPVKLFGLFLGVFIGVFGCGEPVLESGGVRVALCVLIDGVDGTALLRPSVGKEVVVFHGWVCVVATSGLGLPCFLELHSYARACYELLVARESFVSWLILLLKAYARFREFFHE